MTGRGHWPSVLLRLLGSLVVVALGLLLALLMAWPMGMRGQGMWSVGGALLMLDALGTALTLGLLWKWGRTPHLWPLLLVGAVVVLGLLRLMGVF